MKLQPATNSRRLIISTLFWHMLKNKFRFWSIFFSSSFGLIHLCTICYMNKLQDQTSRLTSKTGCEIIRIRRITSLYVNTSVQFKNSARNYSAKSMSLLPPTLVTPSTNHIVRTSHVCNSSLLTELQMRDCSLKTFKKRLKAHFFWHGSTWVVEFRHCGNSGTNWRMSD